MGRDKTAQLIGLIAYEFGYSLEYIGSLSNVQLNFLSSWLNWYYQRGRNA